MIQSKLFILGVLMVALSCTLTDDIPPIENPLDPGDSTHFIPPDTYLIAGPVNQAVVDTHSVTFAWTGNEGITAFSYRINDGAWSDWSTDTTITYDYLDEGNYTFYVAGRYTPTVVDTTPVITDFTIDAIHGPGLWFRPRRIQVGTNTSFDLYLTVEDASDLLALYTDVWYDTTKLTLISVSVLKDPGAFLTSTNGSVVDILEYPTNGRVEVNLAITNATPPGVTGTGAVMKYRFRSSSNGITEITLSDNSRFINAALEEVTLQERIPARVEIH